MLGRPVVDGDRVFVGSTDNYLYALDVRDGTLAWRYAAGGDVVGAAADDRFVYFAALDNLLRALRRGSGNQVWKRASRPGRLRRPSTFGGIVLVTGNSPTLSTFNATTGLPIANFTMPADLQGMPLVDPTLEPFRVAVIAVTRDARAIGLRPAGMMFRELPVVPLQSLPGRPLNREPLSTPNSQLPNSQIPRGNSSGRPTADSRTLAISERLRQPPGAFLDALGRRRRERQPDRVVSAAVHVEGAADDEDHSVLKGSFEQAAVSVHPSGSVAQMKKPPLGVGQVSREPRLAPSDCAITSRLWR